MSVEYYGTVRIDEKGVELAMHVSRFCLASRYRRRCQPAHGSANIDR